MSLSSIAVEQREREAKKLSSFLVFGLIGSIALHVGVLSLNIGNLTKKAIQVKDKPLEIEIVELPDSQKPKIKQTPQAQVKDRSISNSNTEGSIDLSSSSEVAPAIAFAQLSRSPNAAKIALSKPVIKADKQAIPVAPIIKVERLKTQPIPPQKVAQAPKATANRQPQSAPAETTPQQKPIVTSPPLTSAS